MRLLPLFIFVLLFQSCLEKTSEAQKDEVALKNKQQNSNEYLGSKKVVSLNFEALQQKYFQKKTDTTYIINFWATWCKPCVEELPAFEKIAVDYSGEKIKILLVSLDFPDKIESQVIPFIYRNSIQSEVVLLDDADANSWIPKVSKEWSGAIPATLIYKKDNRKFYEQSFIFEQLESELKTFL